MTIVDFKGQVKQLRLFEEEPLPGNGRTGETSLTYPGDPAFARNKTEPVHRWVPWIAGFSAAFVRSVLEPYLPHKGTVLDPFAGVGTTLVEAILAGHRAIGFEINPYAALACRVKANAHHIEVAHLVREMARFREFFAHKISTGEPPRCRPPKGFRTRSPFYSPAVLHKVLLLQDFIATIQDEPIRDLFRLAFASTMVCYSNYSYEPSLGRRTSAGKKESQDFPVAQTILHKLSEMAEDIAWMQGQLPDQDIQAQVIQDSCLRYRSFLSPETVDLIITSPPYLNNYHYNRNTRPQLYWLGYAAAPGDLRPLEEMNFGRYWQTVREKEAIEVEFSLPNTDLVERLQELRSRHPEKGTYGGKGWANYAACYFNDCYRFAQAVYELLRPGGVAVIVIGNSILQGVYIPTDRYLAAIAEAAGLEVLGIEVPRETRVGNSIIRSEVRVAKAKASHRLYEAVVTLQKR